MRKKHLLICLIFGISFVFQGCFKRRDKENKLYKLTEEEKTWLPYNAGDSIFLYVGDSLYYRFIVDHVESNKIITDYDDNTNYFSYTKEIHLRDSLSISLKPNAIILAHIQEDLSIKISFAKKDRTQTFYTDDDTYSIKGNIDDAPIGNLTIGTKMYSEVKYLSNINGEIFVKQGVGILKFKSPENQIFTLKIK